MLLFHADLGWAQGGFLGVSTFYTLSGFLITSLLLAERNETGRVDFARFALRRARRLLPAGLAGLLAALGLALWNGAPEPLARLHADLPFAAGYALNWWLIASDYSYALIFSAPSPVQHYWSLAIEAQFYLVLPLALALAPRRLSARAAGVGFAVLGLASVALSAWLTASGAPGDRIYYGTDTRASELLFGCALAAFVSPRGPGAPTPARGAVFRVLTLVALAASLVAYVFVPLDAEAIDRGGLGVFGALSALLVAGALDTHGPLGRVLALRPLAALGRVSYGVYVYHWPIYLALTPEALGLGDAATNALRVSVVLAVAVVSERFLERPLRRGPNVTGRRFALGAAVAVALTLGASFLATGGGAERVPRTRTDAEPVAGTGPHVAFFGDSSMFTLSRGAQTWLARELDSKLARGAILTGCALTRSGDVILDGRGRPVSKKCRSRRRAWREAVEKNPIDVAVVLMGPWEVLDHRRPGEMQTHGLGEPQHDAATLHEILDAVDRLSERGAVVLWLTSPTFDLVEETPKEFHLHNDRVERFNALLREAQAARPGRMHVAELGAWMSATPPPDGSYRVDGVHFRPLAAQHIGETWLAPRIAEAHARGRRPGS